MKFGIVGAGRIGRVHAQSIQQAISGSSVVAITDVIKKSAESAAAEFGIPKVYDSYEELVKDPNVDAVLVCSSTDTHATVAIAAANAKKHVFCEKPVDLSVEKILAVKEAVTKNGVKLQVGFNRRFDHNFSRIKELSDSGELGKIEMIKITSRDPAPPPIEYVKVSGGIFTDMTIHDFDMACFQAGCPVTEVYAKGAVLVDKAIGEAGDIDTALITLTFENGVIGLIDNSRRAAYGYDQRLEVFGSKGAAVAENDKPTTVTVLTEKTVSSDKPLYFFLERYMKSFTDEIKAFIDSVENNKPTLVDIDDGLRPILIAQAAKKSLDENRPVKVEKY